ncbi:MAG: bifunctional ADP-dependent NAD(P)H-hydrate dehydratase/NAD(P)H-hydrate epimerase [Firmicutes bacterium]|nr:bifunctional ADP-dependent NAD(P)H-hydrate dehydratase/NAD(P)H-hydrate epimerase [Bacillota bacterium]
MIEVTEKLVRDWLLPRERNAHKGDFGKVHILAGSVGYTGAPYFAAQGAARSGAGLVFLHVSPDIWPVLAVKCNEVMVSPAGSEDEATLLNDMDSGNAVLIGPGLGRSQEKDARTRMLVQELIQPLVLDADGINAVAGHIHVLEARRGRVTVLTPHEGEFSRLLDGAPITDRARQAEDFARMTGCILVLKGHRTVTAFPDGHLFVNTTGNPGMAKGGSGDVLAGMMVSLLAQGLKPERAVPLAVWLHGRAGDLCARDLGEHGMIPTDLMERIPLALSSL